MNEHRETRQHHVLIVEDDDSARLSLVHVIARAGYQVSHVADGEQAIALLERGLQDHPDVVVTDLLLHGVDGVQVLKIARGLLTPPEVILLTGFGTLQTAIAALRYGAFDYLLKPCQPAELLQCLARAVERRQQRTQTEVAPSSSLHLHPSSSPVDTESRVIQVGELYVVPRLQLVSLRGNEVHLTSTEYQLMLVLIEAPGQLFSYEELVRRVYHQDPADHAHRLLKTHMYNLRRKLSGTYIRNRRGVGYWLADPTTTHVDE